MVYGSVEKYFFPLPKFFKGNEGPRGGRPGPLLDLLGRQTQSRHAALKIQVS